MFYTDQKQTYGYLSNNSDSAARVWFVRCCDTFDIYVSKELPPSMTSAITMLDRCVTAEIESAGWTKLSVSSAASLQLVAIALFLWMNDHGAPGVAADLIEYRSR